MRLTLVLQKHPIKFHMNKTWKRKGYVVESRVMVPQTILAKGVEIIDAVEAYFPKPKLASPSDWVPEVPTDPRWYTKRLEDHPDYKQTPILEFNWRTRLLEGEKQALILTKCQSFEGLPDSITQNIGAVKIPNKDRVVQRAIMQANKWDGAMEPLPKRFSRKLPGWNFKKETGIPARRRCELLASNLLRIIRQTGGKYPDVAHSLRTLKDPYVSSYFNYDSSTQIAVRGVAGVYMTYTNQRLPAHADAATVTSSETHTLPDIFPISPLVDLSSEHIWRDENITGFREDFSHPFPHTLYMNHRKHWSTSQRRAQALMYTFSHALACAKNLYGPKPRVLPEPLVVNCVHTNNSSFDFLTLQLNTTDVSTVAPHGGGGGSSGAATSSGGADQADAAPSGGVKNMVWFDSENALYERIEPARAMLRNSLYHDYDSDVFDKLVALHLYGLDLSNTWQDLEQNPERKQRAVST